MLRVIRPEAGEERVLRPNSQEFFDLRRIEQSEIRRGEDLRSKSSISCWLWFWWCWCGGRRGWSEVGFPFRTKDGSRPRGPGRPRPKSPPWLPSTHGRQSKSYCTGRYDIFTRGRIRGYCMNNFRFSVVIEKDEDGYTAFCPELQGCYAQGETYEEVLDNIRDAIRLHLDDRINSGEKIPQAHLINLTTVDVTV